MRAARVVARRKIEFLEVPEPGPLGKGEVQVKLEPLNIMWQRIDEISIPAVKVRAYVFHDHGVW